jgi:gamma-D-glutamyl-L-lysine dipeptidyl-peptidase
MNRILNILPVVPVRKKPDHRSELVSQVLFGETATILKNKSGWQRIKMDFDNYTGWIEYDPLHFIQMTGVKDHVTILAEPLIQIKMDHYPVLLPAGSELPVSHKQTNFTLSGHAFALTRMLDKPIIDAGTVALKFMHAPYLWGGRTVFGTDCSGLVQLVYKITGMNLPRDAKDQAMSGQLISINSDAQPDDLFFFGKQADKITHVGIYLGNNKIIHASKSVRIDRVDDKGIFNNESGVYTHPLQFIRRINP